MMIRILMACCTLLVMAGSAAAQDAQAGGILARRWCAGCHAVEPGGAQSASDLIPPFAAIAAMPSTTEASLAAFLSSPHANMPDYSLTRIEIAHVSAYILSLRKN